MTLFGIDWELLNTNTDAMHEPISSQTGITTTKSVVKIKHI